MKKMHKEDDKDEYMEKVMKKMIGKERMEHKKPMGKSNSKKKKC